MMKPQNGLDYFWPYDSIDEIYVEKYLPEFGLVPSKWQFFVPLWRFFHAENRDMVPLDFKDPECDDSLWDAVDLPSVWQQEGYGLPVNLMYDAGTREESSKLNKRIQAKLAALSGSETDDDVGIYRTWIQVPAAYDDRAVYFYCSGIRGRFELYVNGNPAAASGAIYSSQKILISPFLKSENNLLTVLVYRLDSDRHGRVRRENGTFGFSGIFRMPEIIAESLVEITNIKVRTSWIDEADENALPESLEIDSSSDSPAGEEVLSDKPSESNTESFGIIAKSKNQMQRKAGIRVEAALQNHTDLLIPVRIEYRLIEVRNEYDLYHLPEHALSEMQESAGTVPGLSESSINTQMTVENIMPWTDQTPDLYDLTVTLKDTRNQVICVKKKRIGFRTTEILGRIFHINEIAIPLRAVRYFDFDPVGGLAVSAERFRQDICLMKQANLNTVLTAHFPSDPLFYQMCDHYGLYVISQADGVHAQAMIENLMTHPSIVCWSFAPLHFDEARLWELKQKLLLIDNSRPFYSEKDRSLTLSDLPPFPCEAGTLFGEWSDICIDKRILQSKLEPGHSVFETMPGRAKRDSDSADFRWIHQGDLEEFHEKMDVPIAQGIVSADRIPHPVYYEIKKQCETLQIVASADSPSDLSLINIHPIGQTNDLILYWKILMGGQRIRGGKGLIKSIQPLGKQDIRFPFTVNEYLIPDWMMSDESLRHIYDTAEVRELVLDVRVCYAEDTSYAPKGHETAFYQQVILEKPAGYSDENSDGDTSLPAVRDISDLSAVKEPKDSDKLTISTRPEAITVKTPFLQTDFSRKSGGMSSVRFGKNELFAGSLQPSFYRAATNSDRSDQSFVLAATVFSKETDWRTIQHDLRYKSFQYEMNGEDFSMLVHYKSFAFKGEVLVQYIMGPGGKLSVTLAFTPRYDLLRSGFRVNIPEVMSRLAWYGRGLHEAYPDRRESARIGFYEASPEELYHEYARPQENGGHCDTKYLLISDGSGKGIKITASEGEAFSFSASLYSPEEIDDHQHQEELLRHDSYELFLDFYQRSIERSGQINRNFIKNQTYRGTFIFEPWEAAQSEPSDHESL